MTSAPAAISPQRPAQAEYLEHLKTCRAWCWLCAELIRAADVEDGHRLGWPEAER